MSEEVASAEQSSVLTSEETTAIVEGTAPEEAVLPSDTTEFEVPDKFEGKSIEEVIKSYQELEKLQSKGGDEKLSQEEKVEDETPIEETSKEDGEKYQKYAQALEDNGSLSDSEYAELAKEGNDKATVDAEIVRRADQKEFEDFRKENTLNSVLEPLGGGAEKFKAVSDWANETKTAEEVKEFNDTLASVPKLAQQALLKQLYAEYESGNQEPTVLHTGSKQTTPSKGYSTQEEFFKDVGSPEYQNNPAYRAAVEAKMAKSGDLF